MPNFLPPATSDLILRIVARNARRARRAIAGLTPAATGWRLDALQALDVVLASIRGSRRTDLLFGPDLRCWLSGAETALILTDPRADDEILFDRIARGPHLAHVVPHQRLDRHFRRRAGALGRRLRETSFFRLAPLLAFLTPPGARFGPFPLDLAPDGEEARAAGELHLSSPVPATWRLSRAARLELVPGGIRMLRPGSSSRWTRREFIVGSDIVLGRRVVSTRRGLRSGRSVPGLAERLGRALSLIGEAWEHAHREVVAHTRVVVPLVERSTVSFSLPDRPGVSYINVQGKSLVDLADDLIHETAHHRLHSLEELTRLDRDDGEPRYWSAWRGSLRPLHGILHAAYTFTWRAELLSRLIAHPGRLPRAWIARELSFERGALGGSLADLANAEELGLLTTAGMRLRRSLARRVSHLS